MLDGSPIGYNRALLRWLACRVDDFFVFGYLLIALRRDKRALHDLLAGTKVVLRAMNWSAHRRMVWLALVVFVLDQAAKLLDVRFLDLTQERVVIAGFFKFVHWENTGAAWSLFHDRNGWLAVVSVLALIGLFVWRRHFYIHLPLGRLSLGLIFGGIAGNLFDRLHDRHKVIDFLRFYLERRSGQEIGFPAFNIADSAICIGVGLLILVSWKHEEDAGKGAPQRSEAMQNASRAGPKVL